MDAGYVVNQEPFGIEKHTMSSQIGSYFFHPFFKFCGGGVFPLPGTIAIPVVPFLCRSVHPTKLSITPSTLSFSPNASSFLANQYVKFSLACDVTAFKFSTCKTNSSIVIPCNASSDTLA